MISNDPVVDLRKIKNKENPPRQSWQEMVEGVMPEKPRQEPETEESPEDNEPLKEWQAPEFVKYEKSPAIAAVGIILAGGLLAGAIITKNLFFGVFIVLAAFVLYLYSGREPKKVNFAISKTGLWVGAQFHPFADFKSFWIFYEPETDLKEISFVSKKTFLRPLRVPLENQNQKEIKEILLQFLPEEKQQESFGDFLSRRFGI
ncbi:MAG: hypothetical protein UX53_C0001G0025 [Candidatus Azambacteria bacterium GW2011_GWB2_46_37]|uniref:DUF5673 domain-containing protein n=4 Tax=Candidatus Azamiibacteriota TaxID=1752741 RepID=A0A0G1TBU0_9BACT|nr:MAG: hypothetical protein UX48_C0007G0007 [Candidatus Azambacteria bacterium GW2011_GWB1_46_27]KKU38340.1 MAG: hypothetical protein UX51_C0003G0030 [Candidatus Azambacteria bacterium GW2011_GWF2_46_32]KKU39706.1 MAG: hypothetical protein UX53_C0001G0025 [Candidatus Azambacteria bacterium GW2011_GWB2_46_37]KKU42895.1 MAG: hypothetical protein UX56_C0003G0008 [Candidatus Azambacteria bacterium GW2011_GWD2_46_48]HAM95535.1 hypothetical protein [Candidatus Azambacteria bacterium]